MGGINKVTVRIAGNEYVLKGNESPEYMQRIALYVDRKIIEITKRNHLLSTSMAAVLASVNMADEAISLQEKLKETEAELAKLKAKHQKLDEDYKRISNESAKQKEREAQLKIELAKRETELKEVRNTLNTIRNHNSGNN